MATVIKAGDELHGMVVRIFARKIDNPWLSKSERSGTHKRMETVARDTVRCVIEQPHRWVLQQEPNAVKK